MPTIVGTSGYKAIKAEWSITDNEDKWNDTLTWLNAVSEILYHHKKDIPAEWEFSDSPMHAGDAWWTNPPEDYETDILLDLYSEGEIEDEDLKTFGTVLHRYANLLRDNGEDY